MKGKKYVGVTPSIKQGWYHTSFKLKDWELFNQTPNEFGVVSLKLISLKPLRKANFLLNFSSNLERLCLTTDSKILQDYFPQIFNALNTWCRKEFL